MLGCKSRILRYWLRVGRADPLCSRNVPDHFRGNLMFPSRTRFPRPLRGIRLPAAVPTGNILVPAGSGKLHRCITRIFRRWVAAILAIPLPARGVPGFFRADLLLVNQPRALHGLGGLRRADPVRRWNLPTRIRTDIMHRSRTGILLRTRLHIPESMSERNLLIRTRSGVLHPLRARFLRRPGRGYGTYTMPARTVPVRIRIIRMRITSPGPDSQSRRIDHGFMPSWKIPAR